MPFLTNGMDVLGKLFGSPARVKILRLFLFNPDSLYSRDEISLRTQVTPHVARSEVSLLVKTGMVKQKKIPKKARKKGGRSASRARVPGFILNPDFQYRTKLQDLLLNTPVHHEDLLKRLARAGNLRLVIIAGVFLQDWESRIDLLIVGDKLNRKKLTTIIQRLEAEVGKELRYVVLSTHEFRYRLGVYDRLVRDVLDYPHKKIFNKLSI